MVVGETLSATATFAELIKMEFTRGSSDATEIAQRLVPENGGVYIVTGANAGCGKENVRALAQTKAQVFMACRNKQRGEDALRDIIANIPGSGDNITLMTLDLSDLRSVRSFAKGV